MSKYTLDGGDYEDVFCGACGITFYVPVDWVRERRDRGNHSRTVVCPNGHHRAWGESTLDRVMRERDRAVQEKARLADELAAAERAKDRAMAEVKRVKKRATAALCPCCNRSFANVARHMKTKHPEIVQLPVKKAAP